MKIEEVLPYLRAGNKIRRNFWRKDTYFYKNHQGTFIFKNGSEDGYYYNLTHLLDGDDWEIVKEKKKIKLRDLTEEQYDKWLDANCKGLYNGVCENCPFRRVDCGRYDYSTDDTVWYLNKDLFSDKFLDQEIEVEE